jgi:DNA-binding CsgD family transcriptional regulator
MDCLYHLVKGKTMKQIAAALSLSPKTIEHYLDIIKRKLNCYSRSELIEKALQLSQIRDNL